jgi:SAM-dependent methyltransferase
MEQKHFWHIGRKEIILDTIERNVPNLGQCKMLEIGCGNGNILAFLKQNGVDIEGGDISREGLEFCRKRISTPLYQLDALHLPFRNAFDIIGLFDVLEHIDDDVGALKEIRQALKPNGILLMTVPAYQSLWSNFDEYSGHKRRYDKKELVGRLYHSGFRVIRFSHYMFFLFPLLATIRKFSSTRRIKRGGIDTSLEVRNVPILNECFLALLRLEKLLLRYFNLPFGASLLVLAMKD